MNDDRWRRLTENTMTGPLWLVMAGLLAVALIGAITLGGLLPLYLAVLAIGGVAAYSIARHFADNGS